jgi:opacity protein-like surface antigen
MKVNGPAIGSFLPEGVAMQRITMNWQGAVVKAQSLKSTAKAVALAAVLAAAAGGYAQAADMPVKAPAKAPPPAPFFFVNDTAVSFTYFFDWTDPGVSGGADRVPGGVGDTGNKFWMSQGSLDHFDLWEYGATLLHLEVNQSDKADPIQGQPGAQGAREFYGFAQETFSGDALTHSKIFTTPITNDVGLLVRLTAGTENNFLAEETTQYDIGGNVDFALPKILGGSMQVGIAAHKEHTYNEFNACSPGGFGVASGGASGACIGGGSFSGARDFEWTWRLIEFNVVPLGGLLGAWADAAHIVNLLSVIGPKGTGISTAQLYRARLRWCLGRLPEQRNQNRNLRGRSPVASTRRRSSGAREPHIVELVLAESIERRGWLHVVAGIAWIGSSFYFIHLDLSLKPRPDCPSGRQGRRVAGPRRRLLPHDEIPGGAGEDAGQPDLVQMGSLHDLAVRLRAAGLVYYLGADLFLIDKSVLDLTPCRRPVRLRSLVACVAVYEGLCRSPLGKHEVALALVGYVFLVALTLRFTHVFSGRGAFNQIGASSAPSWWRTSSSSSFPIRRRPSRR